MWYNRDRKRAPLKTNPLYHGRKTTMKTTRQKRLNINNTDRHYNINLMQAKEIENKVMVTRLNEKEIEENMDSLAKRSRRFPVRDTLEYIIFQERYTNDRLIKKLIQHGGSITYYTNTILPYYVLTQLSMNLSSEVVYSMRKEFTDKEQENIELSYMATKVIIDLPVVIPDINPYDVLMSLEKLKTNVDNVQLSYPPLHKSEIADRHKEYYEQKGDFFYVKPHYKYDYFKYIQTSLSIWKMNIWLVCDNDLDFIAVDRFVQKERDRRSINIKNKLPKKLVEAE